MPEPGHAGKHHGVALRPIAYAAAGLALVIVIVGFAVRGLATAWDAPLAGPNAPLEMRIEGPALESAPQDERARYFRDKEALLGRYGWIDRNHGIARIPIDAAIDVLARRHAPASKAGARP